MSIRMFQDIGVDQDGFMEVLVERGTPLPHEFTCRIQLKEIQELTLYEGNHIETPLNHALGTYTVEHKGVFVCSLHINEQRQLKILIDDRTVGTVMCSHEPDDVPIEETRLWWNARKEFLDYLDSTTLFLEDSMTRPIPDRQWILDQLAWARQIVEFEVSAEEYKGALREIEELVNPRLQTWNQTIERSPLPI